MKKPAFVLVVTLIFVAGASLTAQTHRGLIRGRVTDATGTVVSGAKVSATHQPTNAQRSVTSDADGTFVFAELPPGPYRLVIEAGGHRMHVEELTLEVNQERRADVRLEVGALTDRVEVTAPRVDVRRDSALGVVVDNRQIVGLPLDGRNFIELTLLATGTVPSPQGSASAVRGDFSFSANGGREDFNAFLLDGSDNVDPKLNTVAVTPPVDAIQEFEVLTSTAGAAFGQQGAAHVNVITRSGSNEVRGTAWEFFRNGALDARNHFAPAGSDPEYKRNQFGVSFGGPVVRDRTFFFADYEGTRTDEGITRIATVPDAQQRALAAFLPVHPIGRAIFDLFPQPNRLGSAGNFVSSPTQRDRVDSFDGRVDHTIGESVGLMGRYSLADRRFFESFSGPGFSSLPGFGSDVDRRAQNAVLSATQILSTTLVNESRVGFNRVSSGVTPEGGVTNRDVGLPEPWTNPRDAGLSFITVSGLSPIGSEYNNPQQSTTNAVHLSDTATWSRGHHLIKFGGDARLARQEAFRDVQARGALTFTGLLTGSPMTDLLFGLPTFTTLARLDNPQNLRTESYAAFVQDSIDVSSDLTVSLGVRYEIISPPVDADNRATLYNPATGQVQPVGTGDLPRAGYDTDTNNWAPRVGVAWAPGDGATVVRGSYGIHYNQSALAPSEGLYFNAPYFSLGVNFTSATAPLLIQNPFPAQTGFFPQSGTAFQRDLRTPYLHQFNFGVQRQLGQSRVVEAAYVGSRGRDLIAGRDLNQPAPSAAPLNLRPNPLFGDITFIESRARSRYDSLQLRFEQRLERGLSLLAAYTLGKSEDDASAFFPSAGDPNFPQDSNNVAAEWGRSNFDVRHRLSVSLSQELPWEMQVSGVVTLQSGRPFTVALLPEVDNSNTGRSALGFGANDRPNVSGDATLSDPVETRWFNTAAFSLPPFGTFGNAGRNILEGPGYANVNLAVIKHVTFGGDTRLQVRAEAFNVFNRTNFGLPDNYFGSPTFGQLLTADAPRRIQFGARLLF